MSKAKDIARAMAGNPFRNLSEPRMGRRYVCANCHTPGRFVKVGTYYFHQDCPKVMVPFKLDAP